MQEIARPRRSVNNMAEVRKMAGCHLFLLMVTHLVTFRVDGGLTLSKTCGEVACQQHEFCSEYDRVCTKCETVCEKESHNYQEDICLKDCQDYLHDMRYLRKGGEHESEDVEDLRNSVQRLTQLSSASLGLSVVLLLLLCALAFLLWHRSKRSPHSTTREDANKNPFKMDTAPVAVISNPSNGLKLDIPQQQNNSRQTPQPQAPLNSPATTTTPLSIRPPRFPSEDTTLDYAYDNRALTPSPRAEGPIKGETSF